MEPAEDEERASVRRLPDERGRHFEGDARARLVDPVREVLDAARREQARERPRVSVDIVLHDRDHGDAEARAKPRGGRQAPDHDLLGREIGQVHRERRELDEPGTRRIRQGLHRLRRPIAEEEIDAPARLADPTEARLGRIGLGRLHIRERLVDEAYMLAVDLILGRGVSDIGVCVLRDVDLPLPLREEAHRPRLDLASRADGDRQVLRLLDDRRGDLEGALAGPDLDGKPGTALPIDLGSDLRLLLLAEVADAQERDAREGILRPLEESRRARIDLDETAGEHLLEGEVRPHARPLGRTDRDREAPVADVLLDLDHEGYGSAPQLEGNLVLSRPPSPRPLFLMDELSPVPDPDLIVAPGQERRRPFAVALNRAGRVRDRAVAPEQGLEIDVSIGAGEGPPPRLLSEHRALGGRLTERGERILPRRARREGPCGDPCEDVPRPVERERFPGRFGRGCRAEEENRHQKDGHIAHGSLPFSLRSTLRAVDPPSQRPLPWRIHSQMALRQRPTRRFSVSVSASFSAWDMNAPSSSIRSGVPRRSHAAFLQSMPFARV